MAGRITHGSILPTAVGGARGVNPRGKIKSQAYGQQQIIVGMLLRPLAPASSKIRLIIHTGRRIHFCPSWLCKIMVIQNHGYAKS